MPVTDALTSRMDALWRQPDGYCFGKISATQTQDTHGELELLLVDDQGGYCGYLFVTPGVAPYRITHVTNDEQVYLDISPDALAMEIQPAQVTKTPMTFPSSPTKEDWITPPPIHLHVRGDYRAYLLAIDRIVQHPTAGTAVLLPIPTDQVPTPDPLASTASRDA